MLQGVSESDEVFSFFPSSSFFLGYRWRSYCVVDGVRLENVDSNKVIEAGAGAGDLLGRGLRREFLETFDSSNVFFSLRDGEVGPRKQLESSLNR